MPDVEPHPAAHFVPFTGRHLEDALRLSREAGWPHRLEDWALVAAVSKGVVAEAEGKVVATGFCTPYGDHMRFNMVIVDARLRGQGIGRRLMTELMILADGHPISLVATADGQPLYEKLGFAPAGRIVQFQGGVRASSEPEARLVRAGTAGDIDMVAAMDRAATGVDRSVLLDRLVATGTLLMAGDGFAVLRDFGRGRVLGPVVARDEETAGALILAAARRSDGQFLRIDTPLGAELGALLESLGLMPAGGGTIMQKGAAASASDAFTLYALTSQALG
ncbi:GNAT family N-acetyltransferase [Bosea sp. 117]|uniref:GNAT family N-acetyltransferase n=1 Tax=Bosea sp. 117 TaxID=1125973 RepID=UPI00068D93EA|nr:GNAT family N-acetyltransferase [Bosea sp. 117]